MALASATAMTTVNEYRQFANEGLRWAAEAKTEDDRKALLELARVWTFAALRLEGVLTPNPKQTRLPSNRELGTRSGVVRAGKGHG
jgi:hypothetical protein